MTIGERIFELRTRAGLSQEELAEKVGYKSRSAIQKIEGNLRDVSHSMVITFAKALNTTPHYLLGWLDSPDAKVPEKPPPELTSSEQQLLDDFRLLNDEGQAAAIGAVKAFSMLDQYKKSDKNVLAG